MHPWVRYSPGAPTMDDCFGQEGGMADGKRQHGASAACDTDLAGGAQAQGGPLGEPPVRGVELDRALISGQTLATEGLFHWPNHSKAVRLTDTTQLCTYPVPKSCNTTSAQGKEKWSPGPEHPSCPSFLKPYHWPAMTQGGCFWPWCGYCPCVGGICPGQPVGFCSSRPASFLKVHCTACLTALLWG